MKSSQLTRHQLAVIAKRIADFRHYLARLDGRMHQLQFSTHDPLRAATTEAIEKVQGLLDIALMLEGTVET